jgi:hypothetical protein
VDTYRQNNEDIDKIVESIYNELGYVDYPTIKYILSLGILFDQSMMLGYIGRPKDALNYLKESNNVIKHLEKNK